ncbi:MAG: NAD(+)/NADH kinase [Promethearchaeota archaeon]|nr:MAG: NAD(+)/NADH kinase [Candidatus Lokiarchaeota archaeon]
MEKKAIGLACRMDSERAIKLSKRIFEFLVKKGEVVYLETRIAPKIFPHNGIDLNNMTSENFKFLISVGGDGTLLRVANGISQSDPPPIFGVNIGSVGFLDESNDRHVYKDLIKLLSGDFIIETCSKITPYIVKNSEEIKLNNALNEILIVSSKNSKVLQISVKVNGIFLNRSYLDGVIISTSTGSTAYNLSAGGSIVSPLLNIMQITPLNSFARSGLRPMILPIDSEIEINLIRPRLNARIVIDGQQTIKKVLPHTKIRIRKANSDTKFIRLTDNLYVNYFRRLRKKIIGTIRTPLDDSPEE